MIKDNEVFKIGFISRTHGVKGEVELQFTDDPFDRGEIDYVVLEIDGIYVPFFYSEYRYKGSRSALFTFDDVDTEEKGRRLVGLSVYYPKKEVVIDEGEEGEVSSLKALTGYHVFAIDEEESSDDELATYDLGEITFVDDSSMNTLITVTDDEDEERILPLHTDFIVEVDAMERTLLLNIPLELLYINE